MHCSKHLSNLSISDSIVSVFMRSAVMLALLFITHAPANAMQNDDDIDVWYGIDGKKLSGKPNETGIYIHNCKKVYLIIE